MYLNLIEILKIAMHSISYTTQHQIIFSNITFFEQTYLPNFRCSKQSYVCACVYGPMNILFLTTNIKVKQVIYMIHHGVIGI